MERASHALGWYPGFNHRRIQLMRFASTHFGCLSAESWYDRQIGAPAPFYRAGPQPENALRREPQGPKHWTRLRLPPMRCGLSVAE
jgi:hypothetical protein